MTDTSRLDDERWLEERVAVVEAAWADAATALETLRVEMDNFALVHHQRLGPVYSRLDELDALIAEAVAARTGDPEDLRRAYEVRSRIQPMPDLDAFFAERDARAAAEAAAAAGGSGAGDAGGTGTPPPPAAAPPTRVRPTKEAQRLYRDLARRAHPDLAQDPAEQERRSAFIARVNAAYAAGDLAELQALATEWIADPVTAPQAGTQDRADWLFARLEWLAARIEGLAAERDALAESPIGRLIAMSPDDPEGLLDTLADQLLAQVEAKQRELDAVLAAAGGGAGAAPGA